MVTTPHTQIQTWINFNSATGKAVAAEHYGRDSVPESHMWREMVESRNIPQW